MKEKKRALIIAGEVAMQDFLAKHLSQLGLCCTIAGSAHTGIQLAEDLDPDIILVNDKLPDSSCQEVVHSLKTNGQKDTPFITLSYYNVEHNARKLAHLTRPIRLSTLKQHIRRLLNIKEKQQWPMT